MCGIIGVTGNQPKLIRELTKKLSHRGPDAHSTTTNEHISLGHTRLAIIDLTANGTQPMEYKQYTITYNGEIYNFQEIKEELIKQNYTFKTNTDTEVILAAYDCWKEKALHKFHGMFAFVIFDKKKKQLFMARDRFGIKPLYYTFEEINGKTEFIFSSEIQAIPKSNKQIDKEGLQQYFNHRYTIGETTMIKEVRKLRPGHYLKLSLRTKKIQEYKQWYKLIIKHSTLSYNQAKTKLKQLTTKAIKRRMVSDVPVSAFLSGGIDSSIIATQAKRHNINLNTFSLGFETTNELGFAKIVANNIKSNHHEFKTNPAQLQAYIPKMIQHIDEPIADPGFLPILYLSHEVSKHNKVVLSGDGADEIFAGYDKYKLLQYGLILRHLPIPFTSPIANRLKSMRKMSQGDAYYQTAKLFNNTELELLNIKPLAIDFEEVTSSPITNAMNYDLHNLMPNDFFMKADKMSSAYGLEQRVPFMDHELVEFAFSLPPKFKLKLWNEKHILKDTFKDSLPVEITQRRKHGFNVPIDKWFSNELGVELQKICKSTSHKLYNPELVPKLISKLRALPKHKSNMAIANRFSIAQQLWALYVFEKWYEVTFP